MAISILRYKNGDIFHATHFKVYCTDIFHIFFITVNAYASETLFNLFRAQTHYVGRQWYHNGQIFNGVYLVKARKLIVDL